MPGRRAQRAAPALFLLPALIVLGAFVVYPAFATIVRSFYDRAGSNFVGLDNYRTMAELTRMRRAIINSFVWVAAFPSLVVAVGLVLAVLTDKLRWKTAFKTVVFLPMAISLLATGVIWRIVYDRDPDRGVVNAMLNIPREMSSPPGHLSGAVPSTPDVAVASNGDLSARVEVGPDGASVGVGLLRLSDDQIPAGAREASPPAQRSRQVVGVVWRDVRAGEDVKGTVEPGEVGVPGVVVRLLDSKGRVVGSATSAADGAFAIDDVGRGSYSMRVAAQNFRAPWPGVSWLGAALITPAAIVAAVWVWAGFSMVAIGAGLAAVDRQLLEAARVDGASEWQVFRKVTVPMLAPVLGVVFVTMTINALKMFDLVFALAPGSVQSKANVIALEMWRTAFTGAGNRGLGAAVAVLLFVLVLPIMALNIRRFRVDEGRR